jgi:hypothetical protein
MAVTLHLTFDLFQHVQGSDWTLWACIQPHVRLELENGQVRSFAPLNAWATTADTGRTHCYQLAAHEGQPTPGDRYLYVPVNFASDVNLRLTLSGASQVVTLQSNRRAALHVADVARFESDNRPAEVLRKERSEGERVPTGAGPVAAVFNHHIQTAHADGRLTTEALAAHLQLTFWGGTERVLTRAAINNLDAGDVAIFPGGPADRRVTNVHSMLGMMFRLGGSADWPRLREVNTLRIECLHPGENNPVCSNLVARDGIAELFETLPRAAVDPEARISAAWSRPYRDTVWAAEASTSFVREAEVGSTTYFRRRTEEGESAGDLRLNDVERLVVFPPRGQDGTQPPLPGEKSAIQVRLWDAFSVRVERYREFPEDASRMLLRVTPRTDEQGTFRALLDDPQHGVLLREAKFLFSSAADTRALESRTYVGTFDLPWDTPRRTEPAPTVLFHGARPTQPEAFLLVPRDYPITLTQVGESAERGSTDPIRWEWKPPAGIVPAVAFDTLEAKWENLTIEEAPSLDKWWKDAHPLATFKNRFTFSFAEGRHSVDGLLDVRYPDPDGGTAGEAAFLEDLVNYNALRAFQEVGAPGSGAVCADGRCEALNPVSDLFPAERDALASSDAMPHHRYTVRYRHPFQPEGWVEGGGPSPAAWYRSEYERAGREERLGFSLFHTYRVTAQLRALDARVSTRWDWPVANAARAHAAPAPGPGTGDGREEPPPLLKVELLPAAQGNMVRVVWNQIVLTAPGTSDTRALAAYRSAWQTVAEFAAASRAEVVGCHLRFYLDEAANTLNQPVPQRRDEPDPTGAVAGLRSVAGVCATWDATELKIAALAALQAGDPGPLKEARLPCAAAGALPIEREASISEFRLRIERRDPPHAEGGARWKILRPPRGTTGELAEIVDPRAPRSLDPVPVRDAVVEKDVEAWVQSLRASESAITPTSSKPGEEEEWRDRRNRIGSAGLQGRWMAPDKPIRTDTSPVRAALCPVAFRPLRPHARLGAATALVVERYFAILQPLVDCGVRAWKDRDAEFWRDHLNRIRRLVDGEGAGAEERCRNSFLGLAGAAAQLLFPLPALGAAHPAAQPLIRHLLPRAAPGADGLLWSPSGEPCPPVLRAARYLNHHVAERILHRPDLYASAKAFLVTYLEAPGGDTLNRDLFQLHARKIPSVDATEATAGAEPPLEDDDRFFYSEALRPDAGVQWLGFVEELDDARYGDVLALQQLEPVRFETWLDAATVEAPGQEIRMEGDRVVLPTGSVDVDRRGHPVGTGRRHIDLASRRPVIPPDRVYVGPLSLRSGATLGEIGDVDRIPQRFDPQALLRGEIEAVADATRSAVLKLEGGWRAGGRREYADRVPLWLVMRVYPGDEVDKSGGAGTEWHRAFLNDTLSLARAAAPPPGSREAAAVVAAGGAKAEAAREVLEEVAAALQELRHPDESKQPDRLRDQLLDPGVRRAIFDSLQPAPAPDRLPAPETSFRFPRRRICPIGGCDAATPLQGERFQIWSATMLKVGTAPGLVEGDTVYLLVELRVPVWEPTVLRLRHQRNADANGKAVTFAPEFTTYGEAAGFSAAAAASRSHSFALQPVVALERRRLSLRALVRALFQRPALDALGLGLAPAGSPSDPGWANQRLTVTVSHRQIRRFPTVQEGAAVPAALERESCFAWDAPEFDLTTPAGQALLDEEREWFPRDQGSDFILDFRWWDPDFNQPVLAVTDVRVSVPG